MKNQRDLATGWLNKCPMQWNHATTLSFSLTEELLLKPLI
jgi:hypothetical protein